MANFRNVKLFKRLKSVKSPNTFKCRHLAVLNDHYNVYEHLRLPFPPLGDFKFLRFVGSSAQHIFDGSGFLKSPVNPFCENFKSITIKNRILVNDSLMSDPMTEMTPTAM